MDNPNKHNWYSLPIYALLLGLFPALYLWSANRTQEPAYVVIPSLIGTLLILVIINLIAYAVVRNIHRSALLALILSFYLLTFGQFYNAVKAGNHTAVLPYLFPLSAVIVMALLVFFMVRRLGGQTITRVLNIVSIGLVLFQLIPGAAYYLSIAQIKSVSASYNEAETVTPLTGIPQRDVYFILLDNYGRQDILQRGSKFDNSELVNALKQRGFVFPDCAQGNYMDTAPVIGSILNMNYLDTLGINEITYTQRGHYDDMAPLILKNEVINKFHSYGYHVVTFRGFMGLIDITNSDTYVSFEKDKSYDNRLETVNFQALYLKTTLASPINDQFKIYPDWLLKNGPDWLKARVPHQEILEPQFYQVYEQNIYAFDALTRIPTQIHGPKFVYAHMYAAHWPFMMRPDGSLRTPFTQEQTVEGYVDGVRYTNSRILGAIDSILANSKVKPVIILQGDHSNEWTFPVEWSGKDRLKILSAYYLPDGGDKLLYNTISPVNNFRLVFNYYFHEAVDLLPDINHYLDPDTQKVMTAPSTCISSEMQKYNAMKSLYAQPQ